jgi:hypothetical protein
MSNRPLVFAALFAITAVAAWTRFDAARELPPDFDEMIYLPIAYDYREMLNDGRPADILRYTRNHEHPAGNKLAYAAALPPGPPPAWERLRVGKPLTTEARPAFRSAREISAVGGTMQVALITLIAPAAGALLAFDTYHTKYSAQAYLDGVPGVFMILAVLLFERARRIGTTIDWRWLAASAMSLGLAAGGKYLYALPALVIAPFLWAHTRSIRILLTYTALAFGVFLASNPFFWPDPVGRLWQSLAFHWAYAHGEHVTESALPWWYQLKYLVTAAPAEWHRGVFATSLVDRVMLPLAAIGFAATWRTRPIWAAWAALGIVFLQLWPTKWPQYTLLVRPPLYVCAAFGLALLWSTARKRALQKTA